MLILPEPVQNIKAEEWSFINELKSEYHRKPHWNRHKPEAGELDLRYGVLLQKKYPDPECLLDTAWQDLERFLDDLEIPRINLVKQNEKSNDLEPSNDRPGF